MNAAEIGSRSTLAVLLLATAAHAQTTVRVSVNAAGLPSPGTSSSETPSVTADGRFVAFYSSATNLVSNDTNGTEDVFVHDRATGVTQRVSVASSGAQANHSSLVCAITPDGRYVAFVSLADNLVPNDTNSASDIFVHDRQLALTERVSVDSAGSNANSASYAVAISADGSVVGFGSTANNLVPGDTNGFADMFVRDRTTGVTELVSVNSAGVQGNNASGAYFGDQYVSGDGARIAFQSLSTNLVPVDTNAWSDIFVRDRTSGTTVRVSVDSNGGEANSWSDVAAISEDGRYVAFRSSASNLVPGDTNGRNDIFVHDLLTSTTTRVSVDSFGAQGDADSDAASLSNDGRFVAFLSQSANLVVGDTNGFQDAFLRDRLLGITTRVSVSTLGLQGNEAAIQPSVSSDGRYVAFSGGATNWIAGVYPVYSLRAYVHDRALLCPVTAYCTTKVNSLGCSPLISSSGLPLYSGYDAFFLTATRVLSQKTGVCFWGIQPTALPFGGGTLCIQPPLVRSPLLTSGGKLTGLDCSGAYSFHFQQSYMVAKGLAPGATIYGQFWSRDPGFAPPNNVGLTDAIEFSIAP